MLSKLLGAKALAAIVLGTASVGTAAAAATGTLPDSAQATVHRVIAQAPDADRAGSQADAHAGSAAAASQAAGKDGSLPGVAGLCQAYASGQGGTNGARLDSTAFQRLSDAAGGADRIEAFCKTVTAAGGQQSELAGLCRSWLAASRDDRTATMDKAVLDRLTAAAGGPESIAAYCTKLVGPAPAGQVPTTAGTPAAPSGSQDGGSGSGSGGERSTPSHPAPSHPALPSPTPRG